MRFISIALCLAAIHFDPSSAEARDRYISAATQARVSYISAYRDAAGVFHPSVMLVDGVPQTAPTPSQPRQALKQDRARLGTTGDAAFWKSGRYLECRKSYGSSTICSAP